MWSSLAEPVVQNSLGLASNRCGKHCPKGTVPIIVTGVVWGRHWRGSTICCHCDKEAVINVVNHQKAKDPLLCHQMHCMVYASACFDFDVTSIHTPGVDNIAADALSRNDMNTFSLQVPRAASPTSVPLALWLGLSTIQPQGLHDWTNWFSSIIDGC